MALGGEPLTRRIGSEARVMALGIGLWLLGLAVFLLPEHWTLYTGMLGFCAGMFLLHGRLSGHVNHRFERYRGVVNGFYISSYYLGGSFGSWLVPLIHRNLGWTPMLAVLTLLVFAAAAGLFAMLRSEAAAQADVRGRRRAPHPGQPRTRKGH
jgi:YNFM family putative membrane transporter